MFEQMNRGKKKVNSKFSTFGQIMEFNEVHTEETKSN